MRKNAWKKVVAAMTAAALVISVAPADQAQAAKKGKVKSVKVTNVKNKKLTLTKGKTFTVKVKVKTTGKISKKVTFKSSKKSVVSVSAKGKLKAKKKGTAKITVTSKANKKKKVTFKVTVKNPQTPTTTPSAEPSVETLDMTGYTEKWHDDFNGTKLNRDDWNVEVHEAGWVNQEQQSYPDSEENIYIKDGSLILKPIKKTENGVTTYTSGRVNTQNKHDFKYGIFEARCKVPKGQGYLPAFWMMPTDENFYGQWPKCGEIDIMEVMGQETNKLYGSLHFGAPHKQSQGTYVTKAGEKDFSDEYHVYDVEWEPGKISWYVDGIKYHEENNWYSAVEGKGTRTYPAPFDQPFYMILNLAVGGSWVGMTDDTTDFENAAFAIDYVKAYQKDSYDENVTKPDTENVTLREPDANGNYIVNGDFAKAEALDDETGWVYMQQQSGDASAEIKDGAVTIKTKNEGAVDYSVQLVQADLPMKKDASYTLSFDAKATADRQMKVAIQGPDQGWIPYLPGQIVDLTTKKQTYTYNFTVRADSDPNGRLDFNMGNFGSTADIEISNVVLKKTADDVQEAKSVRADGNFVYNGEFDEGDARLGFWEIADADKANVSVTNENLVRKLKVVAPAGTSAEKPLVIGQSDLGLTSAGTYEVSYKASKDNAGADDKSFTLKFAGKEFTNALTKDEQTFTAKMVLDKNIEQKDADLSLIFTAPGTYYVDDVKIVEDALIKNGSFNAGMSGFTQYTYDAAKAEYIIDAQDGEENSFSITIDDTGDADWHVQLFQDGVNVEKGKFYRLQFKAKSNLDRNITAAIQHCGTTDNDWTPYFETLKAALTGEYKTFTVDFEMKNETDPAARFGFAFGKIDERITAHHTIWVDDISLTEISKEEANIPEVEIPDVKPGENLLKNADFANGREGWNAYAAADADNANITLENGVATFPLTDVGAADYAAALQYDGLTLEKDAKYRLTFKASSTADRTINVAFQTPDGSSWYGGDGKLALTSELREQTIEFTPANLSDLAAANVRLSFALGKITDWSTGQAVTTDTPASTIIISDISLVKVAE